MKDNAPATRDGASQERRFDLLWIASCSTVVITAVFLRFYDLGLKPFHHDEGVNGFFLTNLFRDGVYKYDPANYHGPTLYYISLAFAQVFGLETIPIRWSVAIWGVLTVVLAFYLHRHIGRIGALTAALFLALSPGLVYISRYFIHEIFFVFLSLGLVVALLLYSERQKAGIGAIWWIALLLFVCLAPPIMRLPPLVSDNEMVVWAIRILLIALESVLIFFIIRLLLEWKSGRPIYALLAAACVALMFATKETAFITVGTMTIACVCVWARELIGDAASRGSFPTRIAVYGGAASVTAALLIAYKLPENAGDFARQVSELSGIGAGPLTVSFYLIVAASAPLLVYLLFTFGKSSGDPGEAVSDEPSVSRYREAIGTGSDRLVMIVASVALIIYLIVLFFSSFFSYAEGVSGFFEAYKIWASTGSKDHTQNGIFAYIEWGLASDAAVMALSVVGAIAALYKARARVAQFSAFWAIGLFLAYTLIPYKTPWLALSFLVPMCILAGIAIRELLRSSNTATKVLGSVLLVAAGATLAYKSYELNFVRYDDEEAPMVYAHTHRQFLDMMRDIENFSEASGKGKDAAVDVVSPDYWPMVWYMKDRPRVIFHGKLTDLKEEKPEMIVAKKDEQDDAVIRKYASNYKLYKIYPLRSGVELVLLVRNDLIGTRGEDLSVLPDQP